MIVIYCTISIKNSIVFDCTIIIISKFVSFFTIMQIANGHCIKLFKNNRKSLIYVFLRISYIFKLNNFKPNIHAFKTCGNFSIGPNISCIYKYKVS
jgi:hypothetical protein